MGKIVVVRFFFCRVYMLGRKESYQTQTYNAI